MLFVLLFKCILNNHLKRLFNKQVEVNAGVPGSRYAGTEQ
jgi:hypothetical protein